MKKEITKKILKVLSIILMVLGIIFIGIIIYVWTSSEDTIDSSYNDGEETNINQGQFQIIGHEIVRDVDGYYDVVYRIKNISDETLTFVGFSIIELDTKGNINDSYESYNKHSVEVDLKPNQVYKLDLTFSDEDNIASIESENYVYEDNNGDYIEGEFSKKYVVKIKEKESDLVSDEDFEQLKFKEINLIKSIGSNINVDKDSFTVKRSGNYYYTSVYVSVNGESDYIEGTYKKKNGKFESVIDEEDETDEEDSDPVSVTGSGPDLSQYQ
ncbi:hypothetical protein BHF69_07345 [Anaerostipes sp. 992a]|uniref:hypothetical protein n=1 Tax=Anaerostipes sp. 992a TaxID=1261637 RepID=UPI000951A145|nr:hypothetical protein [Anaerostipes sp. 992a]OLR62512.1 hypothetical protein BHF69_07345 [Anaerostipes sp. 992a]